MRKISSFILVLAATLTVTFLYQSALSRTTLFTGYRLKSIDTLFAWRANNQEPLEHAKDIVIVGIDDDSYRRLNKAWPWDRSVYATFLENLQKLNPKVIGFDHPFSDKSRDEVVDQKLAESIGSNHNVILSVHFNEENQLMVPPQIFSEAAMGYGFVDRPYDIDSVHRRSKNTLSDGPLFSFSARLAHAFWEREPSVGSKNEYDQVQWISYRYKPESFDYVPFWKIYAGEAERREIKGKIVLVGPVSPLFHDVHPTPLGMMPGVAVAANKTLSLLDNDLVHEPPPVTAWALWLVLVLLTTFIFYKLDFIGSFCFMAAAEVLIYCTTVVLFIAEGLIVEPFSPMMNVGISYFIVILYKSIRIFIDNITLQKMVITDGLTGLYGQRYLGLRLNVEFDRSQETGNTFCFVMLDVDFFKKVNDTYGHEMGNVVLVSIARVLKSGIRGYDLAARYGGEEFSLVLFRIDEDIAIQTINRIRAAIQALSFNSPQGDFQVTMSAGICSNANPDVRSKDDLIRFADQALYQAKSQGRNQTCVYQPKNSSSAKSRNS